ELGEQLVFAHEALEEHLVVPHARIEHLERNAQAVEVALGEIDLRLAAFADAGERGEAGNERRGWLRFHRPYTAIMLKLFGRGAGAEVARAEDAGAGRSARVARAGAAAQVAAHALRAGRSGGVGHAEQGLRLLRGARPRRRQARALSLERRDFAAPGVRQGA